MCCIDRYIHIALQEILPESPVMDTATTDVSCTDCTKWDWHSGNKVLWVIFTGPVRNGCGSQVARQWNWQSN